MNQINPATYNFTAYREDTFAFALLIENTEGDPIDVNDTFDSVSMRVFLPNREDNPALEPELTVSGNQITGVLSAQDTKKLSGRAYWYEVRVTFNGNEETLLNGRLQVRNAQDGKGAQAADLNVTVDFTTLEVTVQTGDSAALALQALAEIEVLTTGEAAVKGWVSNILDGYGVDISSVEYSDNDNIKSGDFTWPDGEAGSFSDLDEDSDGDLVSIRLNRPDDKYITVFLNGNLTATGY